jgi:hypothetical protein
MRLDGNSPAHDIRESKSEIRDQQLKSGMHGDAYVAILGPRADLGSRRRSLKPSRKRRADLLLIGHEPVVRPQRSSS